MDHQKHRAHWRLKRYFTKRYFQRNSSKVAFLMTFILLNIVLFTTSAIAYSDHNVYIILARGCGMCLNFNCSFTVVLMFRYGLSWLRSTKFGPYLPIDQSIYFHKILGIVIAVQSLIHTIAHLLNVADMVSSLDSCNGTITTKCVNMSSDRLLAYFEVIFTMKSNFGLNACGFSYLSGMLLDVILVIMVISSLGCIRKTGHFKVFYWTHQLSLIFWVFLILHGPIFWCFFLLPGLFHLFERIRGSRLLKWYHWGHIYIREAHLLPSHVTHLVIDHPPTFHFQPGDYIFLNIPSLAANEWHPFTISSAPEMSDQIWLHIRAIGHWTNKVYELFENIKGASDRDVETFKKQGAHLRHLKRDSEPLLNTNASEKSSSVSSKQVKIEVFIDGPFGTSSRDIFQAEHAVLIASGIGVTPYASILQSILYRHIASKVICPKCNAAFHSNQLQQSFNLKRVDFIWINRNQRCFEWFIKLMAQLEEQLTDFGSNEFLKIQMFMTSRSAVLEAKTSESPRVSETMQRTPSDHAGTKLMSSIVYGRPEWNQVFMEIAKFSKKPNRIKVFFCGSPSIGKQIKYSCEKHGFHFRRENF